jgi:flagellar export protein FliJ
MAGFTFRLERVLDLRRQTVEQHNRTLAKILAKLAAVTNAIEALQQEKDELNESWRAAARQLRPETAKHYADFAGDLERKMTAAQGELERTRKEELACRALIEQAMRQQKILEKLRTRALARYQVASDRKAQNALDEFATLRAGNDGSTGTEPK